MKKQVLLLISLIYSLNASAIILDSTRYIYNAEKKSITLFAQNKQSVPFMTQVKIIKTNGEAAPFFINPPLVKINENTSQTYKIIFTGSSKDYPGDRESMFYLDYLTVPPQDKNPGNHMSIGVKTRVKLFYRPSGMKDVKFDPEEMIQFTRTNAGININNKGPYHISFGDIFINDKKIEVKTLPPFSSVKGEITSCDAGCSIKYSYIDDYGALRENETAAK